MTNYYVYIIRSETDEVVKKMGPMSRGKAERVDSGANINLDHENYHTEIRTDDQATTPQESTVQTKPA